MPKGIPLGFYISQWLANYILEPLDKFITEKLGLKDFVRYMDDMIFFDNAKKKTASHHCKHPDLYRTKIPPEAEGQLSGMPLLL